jgi:formate hydrogenlyase subunit 3/multisubunit Na+/H+ antiporter MnhD subunit
MDRESRRTMVAANVAMLAMILIHDADHVRQAYDWSYSIPGWLFAVNCLVYLPNGLSLLWTLRGRRWAPLATVVSSLFIAVNFPLLHLWKALIPVWGIWNHSFFVLHADALSWTILASTVAVGVAAAMAGAWAIGRGSQREK